MECDFISGAEWVMSCERIDWHIPFRVLFIRWYSIPFRSIAFHDVGVRNLFSGHFPFTSCLACQLQNCTIRFRCCPVVCVIHFHSHFYFGEKFNYFPFISIIRFNQKFRKYFMHFSSFNFVTFLVVIPALCYPSVATLLLPLWSVLLYADSDRTQLS